MRRLLWAAAAVVVTLALNPAAGMAQAPVKATLGVGGSSTQVALLALNIARTKGFIRDEGVDLQVTDFGSGTKGLQALVGGQVDMVAGVHEHTIRMQAKGQDVKSIVAFSNAPGIVLGVTKAFAPKFNSIKDLKGAKIGVSAPGSATHLLLNLLLAQNGLAPGDVSVIGVGNTAGAVAAIRTGGELQAIVNYDPVISELERTGDIKVIVDTRTMAATREVFKADYVFLCIYTTSDFVRRNPVAAQGIVNGVVRALHWMRTASPDELLAAVPEEFWRADPALYKETIVKSLDGFSRDGMITPAAVKTVYEGLIEYDAEIKAAKIDLAKTYDDSFVVKANKKLVSQ